MKKVIALLVVAILMVGCGSKDSSNKLEQIENNGKLTVALSPDYAPYEFVDVNKSGDDKYEGADVELAKYIAKQLGVELVIAPMAFSDIPGAISNGMYDLGISGFTYEEERAKVVDFSKPYDHSEGSCQGILIPSDKVNEYTTLSDFNGKRIGAQNGSLQQSMASTQLKDVNIALFTDINTGLLELKAGNTDGIAMACSAAEPFIQNNPEFTMAIPYFETEEQDGTMVITALNQPELMTRINEIIDDVVEQGLYKQWMEEAKELANTLGVE